MLKINVKYQLKNTLIRINIDDTEPKIYAVRGPSGIGKTTVLNMIAGLRKADEAIIEVNGQLLTDTAKNVNVKIQQRRIGYLFQDYQLFPNMTVYKNITFMAEPSEHIDHLMKQYPMTLSGGEAQRVALARALSTKPDLILLDEPFSSLDDTTKDESITLVKRIFNEWQIPIIFVTHSNYEAEQMAHEIITIG
ncbi:ATP-binding cassette domain-containing protein [Staphylococcus aureus]